MLVKFSLDLFKQPPEAISNNCVSTTHNIYLCVCSEEEGRDLRGISNEREFLTTTTSCLLHREKKDQRLVGHE